MTNAIPDDENGAVLRRMRDSGDDLSIPRDIDFTLVFLSEEDALSFARHFGEKGYTVKSRRSDVLPALPWDVVVVRKMIPDHQAIGEFENELQDHADPLGGRNDGWGCFEQPGQKH